MDATIVEKVAGESPIESRNTEGKLVQFLLKLKNDGVHQATITTYDKMLKLLMERGANLADPESVKHTIARQEVWRESTKALASVAYDKFTVLNGIQWKRPRYKANRKIPFIPLESEIDALIANSGKKLSTLLSLLKETGIRVGEALSLQWIDLDAKGCKVILNNPEKYGVCRPLPISTTLLSMLNNLPKNSDRMFGHAALASWESRLCQTRKRASVKLQNPRLSQIHFHTLRHWKATMEYQKTRDILHVMKVLGHRNIQNTLLYTQLVSFESSEYHTARATTIEEAEKLVEAGFDYVNTIDNVQLYRRRK